ncbi:MAG: 3-aminobutyryl-CoA ammonia-lyase [Sporichthyaceae bacterium]|jgi:3-aminobutyryl-CoA ammonia-lyase
MTDAEVGLEVVHRRYVPHSAAHYGGGLVEGAYVLGLFGDVATEMCLRTDGDEGLLATYTELSLTAAVRAGDMVAVRARLVRIGRRSRSLELTAEVYARARPDLSDSAGEILQVPLTVATARAEVVVP